MPSHPVVPPGWIVTAPIVVTESIDIAASPSRVWDFIRDHEAWGSWFKALDKIEVTGARTGVGGARRVIAGRVVIDEHFTAWVENEHFAFAVTKSPIPFLQVLAEEVCLEPSEKGCQVTYRQGLQAKKGFDWLLKRAWKKPAKELVDALKNLRDFAEREARGFERSESVRKGRETSGLRRSRREAAGAADSSSDESPKPKQ